MTSSFGAPVVAYAGSADPHAPLVVLLHGRGADESTILGLAAELPTELAYAAVRAPIVEGGGFAWFANQGIGRPIAASLRETLDWFRAWVDVEAAGRPVVLVGFSGGGAFAGGLVLDDPFRWAGTAVLFATLPFEAGVPTTPGRLVGSPLLVIHGDRDTVIPADLLERTWAYATTESGATLTTHRSPGGHGVDEASLEVLRAWLRDVLPA